MIDELELAFDDEPVERWRHRRGRKRGQKKRGGAGKSVVALLVVVLLLGGLGAGVWYGYDRVQGFFTTPDYEGAGQGTVNIQIKQGDTATDIANALVTADVVKSAKAFTEAAKENSRSQNIQPGTYKLRLQMSGAAALTALLDLKNKVVNGVLVREGLSAKATFKLLSEKTKIPVKDFEAAAKDPIELGIPDWWFKRSDGKQVKTPTIEGFLFPDTYEIDPKWTAKEIVRTMVDRFLTVTGELKFDEKAQALNLAPYDVLIVASLSQAEAGIKEDLGKVSRVAYNRLYGDFPCGCLEMDVTVNYWRELKGLPIKPSKDMTVSELDDPKNPYNRKLKGIIPTPINNPGKQALEGAMAPPQGNWLYFVAIDKSGKSAFTNDFSQHQKNQQTARENGVL
ncbi:endolytic transglycosylase MltG [Phytohabitans sp. LJ34]|uniref:endolytic transglycosylase MltG n=1 Tax=Phytohabitans sp. LJ34 TaxID=3452217 RepID=UPI003F8BF2E0